MAVPIERLDDDFEFSSTRGIYPWDEWTDGSKCRAIAGVHFTCKPASFQMQLYEVARRKGLSVTTSRRGQAVIFQFFKAECTELQEAG